MKRFLLCLLALLLLAGCGEKAPQPVKLDDSFVIVCGEEEMEAAVCLQTTLAQRCGLELEIGEAAQGARTVTLAVDESLEKGQ